MSDFYTFAGSHPIVTVLLAWMLAGIVTTPFKFAFRAYNRRLRSKNIAAHGWPTAPVDADGDIILPEKK